MATTIRVYDHITFKDGRKILSSAIKGGVVEIMPVEDPKKYKINLITGRTIVFSYEEVEEIK